MRKSTCLPLIFSAALGLSPLALAQGGPGPGPHSHAVGMVFRGLNLTDAQKAQIKEIKHRSFAPLKSQVRALRQQRAAFAALSPSAPNYQSAGASLAQAEAQLTKARITARIAAATQIYNYVLSPAQQSQFANRKAAMANRKAQ